MISITTVTFRDQTWQSRLFSEPVPSEIHDQPLKGHCRERGKKLIVCPSPLCLDPSLLYKPPPFFFRLPWVSEHMVSGSTTSSAVPVSLSLPLKSLRVYSLLS